MPKADEVAVVTAFGVTYGDWESVEFERRIGSVISHVRLRVAEIGDVSKGWKSLRLKTRDKPIGVTLAGRTIMTDGEVSLRQVSYAASTHQIEIVASSRTLALTVSTTPPQQFTNSSLQQIANAIVNPFGMTFKLQGNTAGAEKPFERVSTHVGETCFQAIEMLCRMRNLHLVDDAGGNLVGTRASGTGASVAQLVEGQNIESAHAIMSIDETVAPVTATGTNFGNDSHWGDQARDVSATAQNPDFGEYRPLQFVAEHPGDKQDMAMRANFEVAWSLGKVVEAYITVPGWLRPDGTLWVEHLTELISIQSPMLFPVDGGVSLALRGVKHVQDNDRGTVSILELCLPNALSAGAQLGPGTDVPPYSPAQPDGGDN